MPNLNPVDNYLHGSWEALGNGAPTLVALAQLCSESWALGHDQSKIEIEDLLPESQAILFAARERGIIEIRAVNSAFDAAARLLAVYVELSHERTIAFRSQEDPAITVRFLEGFRELCGQGLVLHHIYRDFSLSAHGLRVARAIDEPKVAHLLALATEFGLHD
jgi:hypothetical protein